MTAVDPILTSCPRDNCEEAGHACIEWEVVEVGADGRATASRARVVEPHPERVEKAEAIAKINARRIPRAPDDDAATLGIMEIVTAASELDRARILALIRCRRELPAIDAIVRVLGPDFTIRPDRLEPLGHARAAWHHTARSLAAVDKVRPEDATWPIDDDEGGTGELHIVNAAGRLWMAAQLVMGAAK